MLGRNARFERVGARGELGGEGFGREGADDAGEVFVAFYVYEYFSRVSCFIVAGSSLFDAAKGRDA